MGTHGPAGPRSQVRRSACDTVDHSNRGDDLLQTALCEAPGLRAAPIMAAESRCWAPQPASREGEGQAEKTNTCMDAARPGPGCRPSPGAPGSWAHALCCHGREITSRSFLITVNSSRAGPVSLTRPWKASGAWGAARPGACPRGNRLLLISANEY